ncbi:MAG: hypothetical protein ABII82_00300 [Verrucomicrobiota bacterium]
MPPLPARFSLLLLALLPFFAAAAPTYKNSWVKIEPPADSGPYAEGDAFEVTVDYHLDPADAEGGGARLVVAPVGPYLGPDNKPVHQSYPRLERRRVPVEPGSGRRTFTFEAPPLFKRNELHFIAHFENADGRRWPLVWSYDSRTDEPLKPRIRLALRPAFYALATDRPANLFTYDEPVRLRIAFHPGAVAGQTHALRYRIHDAYGRTGSGEIPFVSKAPGETTDLILPIERRGIFALEAEVEGWGARELVFARIPDLAALLGDHVTPFGATELQTETENAIARRLGFSHVRHHQFHWAKAQPAPDRWELDAWDRILDTNLRHRIHPFITVWRPPLWIMPDGKLGGSHSYQPFPFDRDAWRAGARHLADRWRDKIAGFEWLNEIVAGTESDDPVGDYLDFCRIGSEAVRETAPHLHIQLAGGIHPRNFRQAVLRSGAARHADALPIHYGDESSVRDARDDLAAVGLPELPVWDNETARALWVWDREWRDIIQDRTQPEWVLTRFPGQLAAGAERIFYFGGWSGGAAGGWNYLMDGETPLPVAITLAVQAAKLGRARSLGGLYLGELGRAHLFETDGRPVVVAHTSRADGEVVSLPVAGRSLVLTDYQGNETILPVENGRATLRLDPIPVFIEGGDADAWRALAAVRVGDTATRPRLVRPQGSVTQVPVHLAGLFADARAVTLALETPPDWPSPAPANHPARARRANPPRNPARNPRLRSRRPRHPARLRLHRRAPPSGGPRHRALRHRPRAARQPAPQPRFRKPRLLPAKGAPLERLQPGHALARRGRPDPRPRIPRRHLRRPRRHLGSHRTNRPPPPRPILPLLRVGAHLRHHRRQQRQLPPRRRTHRHPAHQPSVQRPPQQPLAPTLRPARPAARRRVRQRDADRQRPRLRLLHPRPTLPLRRLRLGRRGPPRPRPPPHRRQARRLGTPRPAPPAGRQPAHRP